MAGLTPKQRKFVAEYLVDLNATRAAIRAGYSAKTADRIGPELLGKTCVREAVEAAQKRREKRTEITQDRVLNELARVAFGNSRAVMSWGPGGLVLRDSAELTEDEAALVSEVRETTTKDGGSMALKTHDKMKALELLGKHLGMFDKKQEDQSGGDDSGVLVVPGIISEEEWLAATKK